MGGEKFYQPFVWDNMVGSPPRGRGKGHCAGFADRRVGITPAWAGKRFTMPEKYVASWDHPRVGGEKR